MTGAFGSREENGEQEIKSFAALHLTGAVLTYSLSDHGELEVDVPNRECCLMGMCGMPPRSKASLHLLKFTGRVYLCFKKIKLLEVSGMVF